MRKSISNLNTNISAKTTIENAVSGDKFYLLSVLTTTLLLLVKILLLNTVKKNHYGLQLIVLQII